MKKKYERIALFNGKHCEVHNDALHNFQMIGKRYKEGEVITEEKVIAHLLSTNAPIQIYVPYAGECESKVEIIPEVEPEIVPEIEPEVEPEIVPDLPSEPEISVGMVEKNVNRRAEGRHT